MEVYNILFVINVLLLVAIIIWKYLKKESKEFDFNVLILLCLMLIKLFQLFTLPALLADDLLYGEMSFKEISNLLNEFLFFGSSLSVILQLISEIINIIILVIFTTKVLKYFVKKASKKLFSDNILSKNVNINKYQKTIGDKSLFLVLGKLLN